MAILNSWVYTKTLFDAELFLQVTGNEFLFVAQKPFQPKKNPDEKGVTVTLSIIHDSMDYGVDKNGHKRESNVLNSFDVTILNGLLEVPFQKGDKVSLAGYIPEKSHVIGFDTVLRFKDVKKAGGSNGKD